MHSPIEPSNTMTTKPERCPRCGHNWKFGEISPNTCGFHQCGCKHDWHAIAREPSAQGEPSTASGTTIDSLSRTISEMIAYRYRLRQVTESLLSYAEDTYPRNPGSTDRELEEADRRSKIIKEAKEILYNTAGQTVEKQLCPRCELPMDDGNGCHMAVEKQDHNRDLTAMVKNGVEDGERVEKQVAQEECICGAPIGYSEAYWFHIEREGRHVQVGYHRPYPKRLAQPGASQPLSTQDETAEQFATLFRSEHYDFCVWREDEESCSGWFRKGKNHEIAGEDDAVTVHQMMVECSEAYASSRLSAAIDPLWTRLEAAEQGLATKVKVLEHALAAAQKENLELLRQLGIQIKAWEGQSDLREEAETKLAAAEKELERLREAFVWCMNNLGSGIEWGGPFDDEHKQGVYHCTHCDARFPPSGEGIEVHNPTCGLLKVRAALGEAQKG